MLETTFSDASFQNGKAERPHRTYGYMMRTMLHGADLLNTYRSYSLIHAVYLKNRMPHRALDTTPYEMLTGNQPDVSHLLVFGSFFTSKISGDYRTKLATNITHGIFLGFTGTDRNVIFRDELGNQVKCARHVVFDEIHYNRKKRPPFARQLYDFLGEEDTPATARKTAPPPVTTPLTTPITITEPTVLADKFGIETILNDTPTPIPADPTSNIIPIDDTADPSTAGMPIFIPDDHHIIPDVICAAITNNNSIIGITLLDNPFGPSILHHISTSGVHPTLRLILYNHQDNN